MKKIIIKKFILPILLVGIFFTYSSAFALTTATVTATVMVQNVSITAGADGSVAYGTLAQNATQDTCTTHLSDAQTITNNGNVAETFQIKGQNSAGWTLAGTAGTNTYVQKFLSGACATFSGGTALTTSYQDFATNIAASGTATLNLQINTPNQSTVFTQQSVDVLLLAVAY